MIDAYRRRRQAKDVGRGRCLRDFHSLLHACSLVCTYTFLDLHPQVAETVLQWNAT
jgi:hypothetical protein